MIAKGCRIRDVDRLVRTYGGTAARWTKRSGPTFAVEGKRYEFHWYYYHGIGKQEIKLLRKS